MAAEFVSSVPSQWPQLASWSQVQATTGRSTPPDACSLGKKNCISVQAITPSPWLAVPDRVLRLHDAEGRDVSAPDLHLERACANKRLTSLAWHPAQLVLALGSQKGKCCQAV